VREGVLEGLIAAQAADVGDERAAGVDSNTDLPVGCETSSLKCKDGTVRCPTGVGSA
jgi:hypothetical protein